MAGCVVERLQAGEGNLPLGAPYYCEVPAMLGAADGHRIGVCGRVLRMIGDAEGAHIEADFGSRPCAQSPANDARVIESFDSANFAPGTLGAE